MKDDSKVKELRILWVLMWCEIFLHQLPCGVGEKFLSIVKRLDKSLDSFIFGIFNIFDFFKSRFFTFENKKRSTVISKNLELSDTEIPPEVLAQLEAASQKLQK